VDLLVRNRPINIIAFDIDETICKTKNKNYKFAVPIKSKIQLINKLYNKGYKIKIFTARYMGKYKGNISIIRKKYYKETFNQLISWGLRFHELVIGKPVFDIFVDDKAYNNRDEKLRNIFKKLLVKKIN
jgi:hypothetical protein